MSRVLPVVLALLLVLPSPAIALTADAPTRENPESVREPNPQELMRPPGFNDTIEHLSLGEPDRTRTNTPSVDLGAALEMSNDQIESSHRRYTLDQEIANAKSGEERRQVLIRYRYELELRIQSLQDAERTANQRFNDDSITAQEYAKRLAILDAQARETRRTIDHLSSTADRVPRSAVEVRSLKVRTIPLEGPVRERIGQSFRGEDAPNTVYIATTSKGVVLSTIESTFGGPQYVREAYRADYRDSGDNDAMTVGQVRDAVYEQYSWLSNQSTNSRTDRRRGVWETRLIHPKGVTTVNLDGDTGKVYREIQAKELTGENAIQYGEPVRNDSTTMSLAVNRTYAGGPLKISVTDGDGDPLDARISVGGRSFEETEANGTLFTVSPGKAFTVSAKRGLETTNVTVTPYGVRNTTEAPTKS